MTLKGFCAEFSWVFVGFSLSCVTSSGSSRRDAASDVQVRESSLDGAVEASASNADATRALLLAIDSNVVAPELVRLRDRVAALTTQLQALQAQPNDSAMRVVAQASWRAAMESWQVLALFEIGPLSGVREFAGEDLGAEIYAWPLVNACRVDQELVRESYRDPATFAALNVGMRGLAAIEYVLFVNSNNNACSSATAINSDGTWAQISPTTIVLRRVEYALAATQLVTARIERAITAWREFANDWTRAGAGSTRFDSAQRGLNLLSDGLYYLPHDVKDLKVGHPLGVAGCLSSDCIGTEESLWAEESIAHIRNNIRGFRAAFAGVDDTHPSLSLLLRNRGRGDVVERVRASLDAASVALNTLRASIGPSVRDQRVDVTALHDALRDLNNLYKTEVVSALDLELPRAADGDND